MINIGNRQILAHDQILCKYTFDIKSMSFFTNIDWKKANMTLKVIDINLPMYKYNFEKLPNGKIIFQNIEYPGTVTMSVIEDINFSVYEYMKDWMEEIYDRNSHVYNSKLGGIEAKYFFRIGTLTFIDSDLEGFGPFGENPDNCMFTFNDLIISGIEDITPSQESAEPLIWSITMEVGEIQFINLNRL